MKIHLLLSGAGLQTEERIKTSNNTNSTGAELDPVSEM